MASDMTSNSTKEDPNEARKSFFEYNGSIALLINGIRANKVTHWDQISPKNQAEARMGYLFDNDLLTLSGVITTEISNYGKPSCSSIETVTEGIALLRRCMEAYRTTVLRLRFSLSGIMGQTVSLQRENLTLKMELEALKAPLAFTELRAENKKLKQELAEQRSIVQNVKKAIQTVDGSTEDAEGAGLKRVKRAREN